MSTQPSKSPVILAFEASSSHLSAALYADGQTRAMKTSEAGFGQAASLVPLAVSALAEAGVDFTALSHVAAGRGPGSFTGLRVSLAAAKGVCLAHDLPGLGISGLEALAFASAAPDHGQPILCLADTRRGNVYAQFFAADATPHGDIFEAQIAQLPLLVPSDMALKDGLLLTGFGTEEALNAFQAANIVTSVAGVNGTGEAVDAAMIAQLAAHNLKAGILAPLTPLYLADPRLGPKKQVPVL